MRRDDMAGTGASTRPGAFRTALALALCAALALCSVPALPAAADSEQQPADASAEAPADQPAAPAPDEATTAPEADAAGDGAKGDASKAAQGTPSKKAASGNKKAGKVSAKADKIAEKLGVLTLELESATEDLGALDVKVAAARKDVSQAKKQLAQTKETLRSARENVNESAREIYKNGETRLLAVLLGATNFEDFASRLYLYERITTDWIRTFERTERLKRRAESEEKALAEKNKVLSSLRSEKTARGDSIAANLETQLKTLSKLDDKLVKKVNKKVEKYLLKHASLSKRANSAATAWFSGSDGASLSRSGSHPKIVDIARSYLGVKYVWGGETPEGGFDCSGLVMYCYDKIGIKLTHYARTQYNEGKHIAKSALMPGDLVFFGPDVAGIHHVGIYIGGDRFIHAPQTGDVVKISSLSARSDCVGACRPSK